MYREIQEIQQGEDIVQVVESVVQEDGSLGSRSLGQAESGSRQELH